MLNFGPLAAEIVSLVWGTPWQISTGFASCLRHCCDVAHWRPTTLCTMFGRILRCYTRYFFGGSCPLTEFCRVQNSLYIQVLRSLILAALLHGTPAAASAKLCGVVGLQEMAAMRSRCGHYIFALWFLLSFFFFISSPNLSRRRLDAYHTSTLWGYIFATKTHIDNRQKLVKQQYLLHMCS